MAAALLCMASFAHASEWSVASLFALLSSEPPGRATFREQKFLAILDRPLESSGELAFIAPDRLEKRTVLPKPELVVIDRERITVERGGKRNSIGLRDNPDVAILVEGIRATLAGDLAALTQSYSVGLDGPERGWRLVLRPRDPVAVQRVDRIEITGARALVKRVEVFLADGDRSVMTIEPVRP